MQSTTATRKRFTLSAPPKLSAFTDEMNDYEGDEEEYGDIEEQFEDYESPDDNSSLAEQLGNYLKARPTSPSQSPDMEDESLVDLLQQRLFVNQEDYKQVEDDEIIESPRRVSTSPRRKSSTVSSTSPTRKSSTPSSLQAFLADRISEHRLSQQKVDQDAQRTIMEIFPQEQSKAPPLSPQRIAQMNTRFRIFEEKKARRLTAKRRESETQEDIEYRFAPTMNSKSRQLTSQFPTFAERQATLLTKKRLQRVRLEQRREAELTRDRAIDLQESVRTPCICSHGNTNRSANCNPSPSKAAASPVDEVRHTQACMRFMEMCSKMNASFAIQRKKEMMARSLDDIIAYQEGKKQRQQARVEIARAKEKRETTFTPQINAKSEKIYAALIRSGKLDTELAGRMVKSKKTPPMPPKLTFQPTISKKSKWLLKKKQRELLGDDEQEDRTDAARPTSPLALDVFSRLQQLSHQRENEAQRLQRMRDEKTMRSKPPVEWNVIQYNAATCRFILQGFDRPNALC